MFRIKSGNEEMVTKTFRLPKSMIDRLTDVAKKNNISVNALVYQMANYCLDDLETKNYGAYQAAADELIEVQEKIGAVMNNFRTKSFDIMTSNYVNDIAKSKESNDEKTD